ncbi:hypothetical protein [Fibrobacter sp. UWB12]|uniref:hypothetical protein n=1 Tax=Fibrobacter sp. UWB12 TaxID=1896203 RepID=UPI000919F0A8|nr:hypothetical protein [Fibrobacter sp. UWB12]SHK71267.1 hypothetical protein SAMN05720759_105277 [Fibrobacter sp. UWB12]
MFFSNSRKRHCEPKVTERSRSGGVAIHGSLLLVVLFALFLVFPTSASAKMDRSDSSYVSTLNMTEEQKEKVYGVDSSTLAKGPTLQELNEENPTYVKREYDHKQQVVVGSVIMFCVALAMVLMNNYNPKR